MIKAKFTEMKLDTCLDYCIMKRDYADFKFFTEISVPDDEFNEFMQWLHKCEKAGLDFFFAVIERYEGHKLLYGFSEFTIVETPNMKWFDFSCQNNDVLYDRFTLWAEESSYLLMPASLNVFLRILSTPNLQKVENEEI